MENTYAIATFNNFDGELILTIVKGTSEINALYNSNLYTDYELDWETVKTAKEFEEKFLGEDFWLEVKQVNE